MIRNLLGVLLMASWLLLPSAARATNDVAGRDPLAPPLGPDVLAPLDAMLEKYRIGKASNEELSQYVDAAVAKKPGLKGKVEILQRAFNRLSGKIIPPEDAYGLEIHFSEELAEISDQPDVVAEALFHIYGVRHAKANAIGGEEKGIPGLAMSTSHQQTRTVSDPEKRKELLSALRALIGCSKTISNNLNVRERMPDPGVPSIFSVGGDATDPRFQAMKAEAKAKHEAEVTAHNYATQQNEMLTLLWLMGSIPFKHLKEELNLKDAEFSKIWMEVKTRSFDGSAPAVR
jgi:hypothetical protein